MDTLWMMENAQYNTNLIHLGYIIPAANAETTKIAHLVQVH